MNDEQSRKVGKRAEGKKKRNTSGFSRGSQSLECLMKSLEDVPRRLKNKIIQWEGETKKTTEEWRARKGGRSES